MKVKTFLILIIAVTIIATILEGLIYDNPIGYIFQNFIELLLVLLGVLVGRMLE